MLNRRQTLSVMVGGLAIPLLPALRALSAPLNYHLRPQLLAEGVWMVAGAQEAITPANGGAIANVAILDSSSGAIIIDSGPSRRFGEALAALARDLTGKPIVRVYLTHFHPDHVFGNQAFERDVLAATPGTIQGLQEMGDGFADAMYRTVGDWMRGTELVVPATAVTGEVEEFGSRRIRPLLMKGHTSSDLVLFDEVSGILFAGDLVFLDRAPTTPQADIERWRINLANLGGIPHNLLMPGHGPAEQGDRGIRQTRDWLETIEGIVRRAFEDGLDINEATQLPLPEWTTKIALSRYEFERTVMHLYPKFEAEYWPRVDMPR
jgi:quinoprotein relay system zinc metallohydrolase 1